MIDFWKSFRSCRRAIVLVAFLGPSLAMAGCSSSAASKQSGQGAGAPKISATTTVELKADQVGVLDKLQANWYLDPHYALATDKSVTIQVQLAPDGTVLSAEVDDKKLMETDPGFGPLVAKAQKMLQNRMRAAS
jgi:hypothetical protein